MSGGGEREGCEDGTECSLQEEGEGRKRLRLGSIRHKPLPVIHKLPILGDKRDDLLIGYTSRPHKP